MKYSKISSATDSTKQSYLQAPGGDQRRGLARAHATPDDDMVLECAIASGARTIVTHNLKDFVRAVSLGVQAKTPGQFLKNLQGKRS